MSFIEKIINNHRLIMITRTIVIITLLPFITYLTKMILMFIYNMGMYVGTFLRGIYSLVL